MAVGRGLGLYWHRCERDGGSLGIVAVAGWMLSKPRQLQPYLREYAACGWDSLACHPAVLNLWFPGRARALALQMLEELAREVQQRPRPIVFATFSGGAKACLYQAFRILQDPEPAGMWSAVRACVAGQVHDSSPTEFRSDVGAKFVSRSFMPGYGRPPAALFCLARAGGCAADKLFLAEFQRQEMEYWRAMHGSAELGPALLLCSKSDPLLKFDTVRGFARKLEELGCAVTLVAWEDSMHVSHLRQYPEEYRAAIAAFLRGVVVARAWEEQDGEPQTVQEIAESDLLVSKL